MVLIGGWLINAMQQCPAPVIAHHVPLPMWQEIVATINKEAVESCSATFASGRMRGNKRSIVAFFLTGVVLGEAVGR